MKRFAVKSTTLLVAAGIGFGAASAWSAESLQDVMKRRGLSQQDLLAASKTYVPTGKRDEFVAFSSGGQSGQVIVYAIPSEAVVTVLDVTTDQIRGVGEGLAIHVEESWVPTFDLGLLGGSSDPDRSVRPVVVVEHLGRRLAVFVSRFIGERQIVQRSVDSYLAGNKLIGGTAILPSGALALLLDVDELVRLGEEVLANALGFGPFAHKLVAGESR